MKSEEMPSSETEDPRRERRENVKGLIVSAVLTALAFAMVATTPFPRTVETIGLGILALLQIACQFRYFLHIDLKKSHRDDLQLILFAGLLIMLMVAGSLWILGSQHALMG